MKLLTISRFTWKDHTYEVGEMFNAEDPKAQDLIACGYASVASMMGLANEPAVNQIEPAVAAIEAGDIEKPSTDSKSKKKKR